MQKDIYGGMQMIVQIDSREKQNNITKYFDKIGQKYIVSKMIAGDYQNVNSIDTLIDLKQSHGDGIAEICMNLTRTINHERLKNEVQRAFSINCKRFIFLIVHPTIKNIDEVHLWVNKHGKVKSEVLEKIMKTFRNKYNVEFIFTTKTNAPKTIIKLLKEEKEV